MIIYFNKELKSHQKTEKATSLNLQTALLYFYSFDGFAIFGHCFLIYAKTLLLTVFSITHKASLYMQ